jgi:hypothetical protein
MRAKRPSSRFLEQVAVSYQRKICGLGSAQTFGAAFITCRQIKLVTERLSMKSMNGRSWHMVADGT